MDDELFFKHWLSEIDGVGNVRINRLIKTFGSAKKVYNATGHEIAEAEGIGAQTAGLITDSRDFEDRKGKWKKWTDSGIKVSFREDNDYPEALKFYDDMPYRIFYKGRLPDNNAPAISLVGARACTPYGKAVSLKISETFGAEGWYIISGMATGVDAFAHEGALKAGGFTCAVLGCGVDICYPSVNSTLYNKIIESGCVMSEFEPGQAPIREHFPVRNRIIAALSDAVIVVEARKKSGSLITADIALEQGKEVFVVPGRITDPLSMGCIGLLNEGANALTDLNDLRECSSVKRKIKTESRKKNNRFDEKENTIESKDLSLLACLDFTPKSLERLIDETAISKEEAYVIVTRLKLEGKIEEVANNMFVRATV